MVILFECLILCSLLFIICYLFTGTDSKNKRNFSSYSKEVQEYIKNNENYEVKENKILKFISNLIIFSVILFICGIFCKKDSFVGNFLNILLIGEVLNLWDFVIIDLLWWRNTKRIRFSKLQDKKYYIGVKEHFYPFLRGIFMFLLISIIDGILLTII